MALCILAAGKTISLAITAFTLSWMHSVEHTGWHEEWRIGPQGLEIVEARIKGSGAGMEPPPDARLIDGWWVYHPDLPPLPSVTLAASGATGQGWQLCADGKCRELGADAGDAITLSPCP
ncbi:DUF1850 domain-containing protein [Thalassospira sp.]|uniref:DUF1850 domain-containing protein n=1 Tax=Thalassospira sp. TaxID=1912094 RepID=UPI0027345230|nr:DUF1850 domain-containing protein [Thalassospira sp.]MDP2700318.1 DUF1850 domain-containing protein [Thalassospira sp.]